MQGELTVFCSKKRMAYPVGERFLSAFFHFFIPLLFSNCSGFIGFSLPDIVMRRRSICRRRAKSIVVLYCIVFSCSAWQRPEPLAPNLSLVNSIRKGPWPPRPLSVSHCEVANLDYFHFSRIFILFHLVDSFPWSKCGPRGTAMDAWYTRGDGGGCVVLLKIHDTNI